MKRNVGQSPCMVCKKPIRPGSGIVKHFGKGGRICKDCAKKEDRSE